VYVINKLDLLTNATTVVEDAMKFVSKTAKETGESSLFYHPKTFADFSAASSNACFGSFKPEQTWSSAWDM
jgi:hypothetical protein